MHPYKARQIEFHGLDSIDGWHLKRYSISHDRSPIDWTAFAPGMALAHTALPQPSTAPGRSGVGFIIAHQGRTGNYAVLGWWDRENELPLRVFVSPDRQPQSWRTNQASESICIWDLEIIWGERKAYIETMLISGGGDATKYLARIARSNSEDPFGEA